MPAPGRPPIPRMARAARRTQLLGAAREVFAASGYHAAAMDDIAERAQVSKPVLYQHFPGKLELYLALLDEQADELDRLVTAALDSTTDNRQRVFRTVNTFVDFVDGDGAHRLLFESDLLDEPAVQARVDGSTRRSVEAVARTIAADTGAEPREAELLSVGLTGMAQVAARWWLASGRAIEKSRAVELLATLAWRGISGSPLRLE